VDMNSPEAGLLSIIGGVWEWRFFTQGCIRWAFLWNFYDFFSRGRSLNATRLAG
jgi:hypothetical protein